MIVEHENERTATRKQSASRKNCRQAFCFLFVGVAAAAVDVVSRVLISYFVRLEYAVALAFPIALTFAFLMSRLFVFESSQRSVWLQYLPFGWLTC